MRLNGLVAVIACAALWTAASRAGEEWEQAAPEEMTSPERPERMRAPEIPGSGSFIPPPALDSEQARFLRERAEEGDASLQCLYGLALFNGSAGRINAEEAREWLRKSAEAGDVRGGFEYGKMLYSGSGGRVDQPEALKWLLPAAEKGNREAAYYVGVMLLASEEVETDPAEGERWLRIAARFGIVNAQADLGIAYFSGLGGVKKDYGEALRWFTLAAKQGHGDACNKLGVMYKNGMGVQPSPERAVLWFNMGATFGDAYAQYNLANSFMNGEWVARDYAQAARWHERSARQGNPESLYYLGCLFAEGIGVKKDLGRARELLTMAARLGNESAGELLDTLWELNDDESAANPPPPLRIKAGPLLREFSRTPLQAVDKGRVVLLDIDEDIEISPAEEQGAFYLTLSGSPGVIYCASETFDRDAPIMPGMTIRGVGGGFSGLPGFLRLESVVEATGEDVAESETIGGGDDADVAAETGDPAAETEEKE